jgi:uncharacterized membrane protein
MRHPKLMRHAALVGGVAVALYVLCLAWRFTITDPQVAGLHLLLLKLALPGFQGMDVASMLWGGLLAFGYGFGAAWLFHGIHKDCCGMKG